MPRIHTNGIELALQLHGDGPDTIVLFMGLGLSMAYWDQAFCDRLAALGLRLVLFDHRDTGRSSHLHGLGRPSLPRLATSALGLRRSEAPYDLETMADDVVGALDQLGIAKAHLLGFSMGGAIAQSLALKHPTRALSLTSLASWSDHRLLFAGRPEAIKLLTRPMPAERSARIEATVAAMRVLAGQEYPFDAERARRMAERAYEHGVNDDGMRRQLCALLSSPPRTKALANLSIPALVIHGDDDPLVPFAAGRLTAKAIPKARFMRLPGVGHELPPPTYERVVRALAELVARSHSHGAATPATP